MREYRITEGRLQGRGNGRAGDRDYVAGVSQPQAGGGGGEAPERGLHRGAGAGQAVRGKIGSAFHLRDQTGPRIYGVDMQRG